MATNIDYDYGLYFSSGGAGRPAVNRILRRREAICVDYAYLMDTLCKIANILNVSIYGYAKDEMFDVNDSLYIDNHAWNAVKLDNRWYVYDVTFSTGRKLYDYTRFSKFLIRLNKKLPVKNKVATIRHRSTSYCYDTTVTFSYPYKDYKFKWLRLLIGLFKLRIVPKYESILNTNYYLCEPELFAVTHYPDNPIWSLLSGSEVRRFECDSAYYHLTDTLYKTQVRNGRVCEACDNSLGLDELNKQFYERRQSMTFNKRNTFYPGECEYNIGAIHFREAKKTDDSLTKVTLLDTAILFMERSRTNMFKGHTHVGTDYSLQRDKNRKKYNFLYDDNKKHLNFINEKIHQTYKERDNIRTLRHRTVVSSHSYLHRKSQLYDYETGVMPDEKRTNLSLIAQCRQQVKKDQQEIDSLRLVIKDLKEDFENALPELAKNIWEEVYHHDSLLYPFNKSIGYRFFWYDDYKKKIVETRKTIRHYEEKYAQQVDSLVYHPSKFCLETATHIFRLTDRRNTLEKSMYQSMIRLVKLADMDKKELVETKTFFQEENKEDYCWVTWKTKKLATCYKGLRALEKRQEVAKKIIKVENRVEYERFKGVNKELGRRRKKFQRIAIGNIRFAKCNYYVVRKYKSEYLKYLRKQRREANKKNKAK